MTQALIIGNEYTRIREDFYLNLFSDLFFGNLAHKKLLKREEGPGHPAVAHVVRLLKMYSAVAGVYYYLT